ncbi:hypothetical protein ElyMa_003612700 [Elysia marginata]|uniref:Uncharacterized protein n=1 Tax=Elysia marginata TaxID=1093978 RepID=A0AAV4ESF3_9GAST|nr:hypothetical protein ElyMa_003612700 [Elysia marginata]
MLGSKIWKLLLAVSCLLVATTQGLFSNLTQMDEDGASGKPTILVNRSWTTQCSADFLVARHDSITIQFETKGNNSRYKYSGLFGPRLYLSTSLDETFTCDFFNADGTCKLKTGTIDFCSCKMVRPGIFYLTFVKIASMLYSRGSVYVQWRNKDGGNITSDKVLLPEVRCIAEEREEWKSVVRRSSMRPDGSQI